MASRRTLRGDSGITLLEVTISMALMAVLMSVAGQAIASYFVTMDMEKERIAAVQSCRTVLGAIREKRTEFEKNYPDGLVDWVVQQNGSNWESYLLLDDPHGKLEGHEITVACEDIDGGAPSGADPIVRVTVTSQWTALRGRAMRASVQSLVADR